MTRRNEIPLPVSGPMRYGFRAYREGGTVGFEPASTPARINPTHVVAVFALIALAAAGYVAIVQAIAQRGDGPDWWFHALVVSFAVLLVSAVGFQWRFDAHYQGATLSREGAATLLLAYRWKNRGERIHRFRDPVCVQILLRHDADPTTSWHDVACDGGGVRREKFRDQIEIDLLLRGTSASPRIPVLTSRWKHLAPSMYLYYKEFTPDANRASAVATLRPLAEAMCACLGIAAEIRVAGGPVLARLEAPEHRTH